MKIGVSNLPYLEKDLLKIEEVLKSVKDLEVFLEYGDKEYHEKSIELLEWVNRSGLNLSIHGPFRRVNLISEGAEWKDTLESFKNAIDITKKYNGEFIVVHSNEEIKDREISRELSLKHLEEIIDYANNKEVIVALENVGVRENNLFNEIEFLNLCNKFKECKVVIDIGHGLINRWDFENIISKLRDRIVAYHVHSNNGDVDSHDSFRDGVLCYKEMYSLIERYTPNSKLILEYGLNKEKLLLEDIEILEQYQEYKK